MFTKYLSKLFQQRDTFHFFLQEHDIEGQKQNGEKPRENKVIFFGSTINQVPYAFFLFANIWLKTNS